MMTQQPFRIETLRFKSTIKKSFTNFFRFLYPKGCDYPIALELCHHNIGFSGIRWNAGGVVLTEVPLKMRFISSV